MSNERFKAGDHVRVSPSGLAAVVVRRLANGLEERGEHEYEVEYQDSAHHHDVIVAEGQLTLVSRDEHAGKAQVAKPTEK